MDKISNINFTGISNIGYLQFKRPDGAKGAISRSLSMVLRDDLKGKDFSEYKVVLDKVTKSPPDYYFDLKKQNILNVECYSDRNCDVFMLNGNVIEPENKTMPIFSYIAKLTKKIAAMHENDIIVNKDYLAYEAENNLICGAKIGIEGGSLHKKINCFGKFFEKDTIKYGAEHVNEFIQGMMNKYFDV